ncbi:hypothetical protein H257_14789 [Aphanomyces astaci]|uniref:Uncharacterized protein n=1 Tax=Aphanomyces astaci TaxID=112090 RepID=W4FSG7_APHAT|nr:hypothetical protein H257_14789 [Aphanomyces astaci]ETV69553.1 hypothetical protein H257_14789 [Aphanomyces astaci]|eukprot:XP_009840977.1 hypothetical protein H257_14789 [Aphanomyces astaci]
MYRRGNTLVAQEDLLVCEDTPWTKETPWTEEVSTSHPRHHDSLYDPSDGQDVQRKENNKGRRFCFIVSIIDSPAMNCRVLALDIFRGGNSQAKELKDYHVMFNYEYFIKLFESLLNELAALGI